MKYPSPLLNAMPDGAHLDMRMKLAIELLKTPGLMRGIRPDTLPLNVALPPLTPAQAAMLALETAGQIYEQGEALGWIEPLTGEHSVQLPEHEMRCIERGAVAQAHANVVGQVAGQAAMERQQRVVQPFSPRLNG